MGYWLGFHSHGGTPNGWFVVENPNLKWMGTGGTPISGNLHYPHDIHLQSSTIFWDYDFMIMINITVRMGILGYDSTSIILSIYH